MITIFARRAACCVVLLALAVNVVSAAPPWARLLPFKKIDADPQKSYVLTENDGPWLIMATSFTGPEGERQARELILDLRNRHNMKAYLHSQQYDFSEPVKGLGIDRYGNPLKMRHAKATRFESYAVLIGDFQSVDAGDAQRTLKKIKYLNPESIKSSKKKESAAVAQIRYLHRKLSGNAEKKRKGFMGGAFITRNPLLPKEFFAPKGLDPLVVRMNKGVKYSLLNCPNKYSVQVATFRGAETLRPDEVKGTRVSNLLEEAAVKAHDLTLALRKQGVPAYEFHDLNQSIVAIGGFDWVGRPRADGKEEINPAVHAIMKKYGANRRHLRGLRNAQGQRVGGAADTSLIPKQLAGISFDTQSVPIQIPHQSIAATYGRRGLFKF